MASHHHHHSHHYAAACNCHCCYSCYSPFHHHHNPPPSSPPTLHHPRHQPHLYPDIINLPNPPHFSELHHDHSFLEGRPPHAAVSSLLHRISALESALRRRSPHASASHSIRDAAARTIQTHFRAFLCRRSRTLRQLQDLAAIKSTLGRLKTLVSKNPQFDYDAVYRRTVNLLLNLDAIRGDDTMIRNGRSSLTTELNKFLGSLEGICLEGKGQLIGVNNLRCQRDDLKSRVSNAKTKLGNLKIGVSEKGVNVEKLTALVDRIDKLAEDINEEEGQAIKIPNGVLRNKIGAQSKVKKNVSFVENGRVYRVPRRTHEPLLEEYCSDSMDGSDVVVNGEDDLGQEVDELGVSSKEAREDDDDDEDENEVLIGSDVENGQRSYNTSNNGYGRTRCDDDVDEFVFRPPLPVKMEMRGGRPTDKRMM